MHDSSAALAAGPPPPAADLTGLERIARNVLASWAGYFFDVVGGFVMPRLIDSRIGQTGLGIWDLCWSLVSYFQLAQIGIGSSVNRYVAQRRAVGDVPGLRRVASSVVGLNVAAGILVLVASAVAARLIPAFLDSGLEQQVSDARWVVLLLGGALALSFVCDVFPGVITGCHRWDLHHGIIAAGQLVSLSGMASALLLGYGLKGLAMAYLCGSVVTEALRALAAYRVCPELRISLRDASLSQAKRMFAFGAKFSAGGLARILLVQTNNLVIVGHLGPGALAVFARPLALVRVVETLANKLSFVLTPTASSLQGSGRQAEVRALVTTATRYCTALVVPLSLVLGIMSDPILRVWMGPRYEQGFLLSILIAGFVGPFTQRPLLGVLTGLNLHGRVALANLAAAALGIAWAFLNAQVFQGGLVGGALALAVPVLLSTGVYVPAYACRRLGLSLTTYLKDSYTVPVACAIPIAALLVASRIVFATQPLLALAAGCGGGGLLLGALYWRYLFSNAWRARARGLLDGWRRPAAASMAADD